MVHYRHEWLRVVCNLIGWLYFCLWTFAFWPQMWLNYKRKTVTGLSVSFEIYNMTAFTFYCIYTVACYLYLKEGGNGVDVFELNDVAFAVHGFLCMAVIVFQVWYYGGDFGTVSRGVWVVNGALWFLGAYNVALSSAGFVQWFPHNNSEFSTITFFGYAKDIIVIIKCFPQLYENYRQKSTRGFAISGAVLDCLGGSCALGQQLLSALNTHQIAFITANVPKLLLSLESIALDLAFISQHYCLYQAYDLKRRQIESFSEYLTSVNDIGAAVVAVE